MQNYVYFIKQKPNKDLGYFGECFIISASHLCACEDGIITSRNNNQIEDLGYFGEHCITALGDSSRLALVV